MALNIHRHLESAGFTHAEQPDRQAIALGEEVGEFLGAYRRWRGQARRTGAVEEVITELADVVITAFVTAEEYGWDLDQAIRDKVGHIMTRGWRENEQSTVN